MAQSDARPDRDGVIGTKAKANSPHPSSREGRLLAEFTWNPDALVNAAGLSWRQIEELTVEVTMLTDGGPATVRLLFDRAGDIVGIEADDRPMGTDKVSPPTKWIGRFRDYATLDDYRVPRFGEVAWVLACWRIRLLARPDHQPDAGVRVNRIAIRNAAIGNTPA